MKIEDTVKANNNIANDIVVIVDDMLLNVVSLNAQSFDTYNKLRKTFENRIAEMQMNNIVLLKKLEEFKS
jgi:hypothetical protein